MIASTSSTDLQTLPSGIAGLDRILGGGFFAAGVYILQGLPGSGKTILANQLCYHHISRGGSAVYLTLLAESHARMLQHIQSLSFFNAAAIPDKLTYLSAFNDLEREGLKGLTAVLRREMRARQAGVLVLDGLVAASDAAISDRELKKFIHEIQSIAAFHQCTVFLLTSGTTQRVHAEHTMVDGLVELEERIFGARCERSLYVRKFRGGGTLRGRHAMRIDDNGVAVYPRVESVWQQAPTRVADVPALSTGVASLDALIPQGGVTSASTTVVVGPSGVGKTTLCLHYLCQATAAEPALMLGFYESPVRLCAKAASFGLDLATLEVHGHVNFMWLAQSEQIMDEMAHHLLEQVDARGVRRLVLDGMSGFLEAAVHPERTGLYFSCLMNELRRRGVTVVLTAESHEGADASSALPYGLSGFVDNLMLLRFAESDVDLHRTITITKMRDAEHDTRVHRLCIAKHGIEIAGPYRRVGALSVDR